MIRSAVALAAAVLVTAAVWCAPPAPSYAVPTPAGSSSTASSSAASSCAATGTTVVVDFHDLGGGVRTSCVADGAGQYASDLFPEAGFPLTYAQRQPGFVCRVSGVPTSDPCQAAAPSSAYWGLWSSTGDAGAHWTYASVGAGSLTIPAGGLVAFSWDDVDGNDPPRDSAVRPGGSSSTGSTPTATPTSRPTRQPTAQPTRTPGPPRSSASDTPTATDTPTSVPVLPTSGPDGITPLTSQSPGHVPHPLSSDPASDPAADSATDSATGTPSAATTDPASVTPTPITPSGSSGPADSQPIGAADAGSGDSSSGSLPWWVVVLVLVVLFAGAAAALVARRRRV